MHRRTLVVFSSWTFRSRRSTRSRLLRCARSPTCMCEGKQTCAPRQRLTLRTRSRSSSTRKSTTRASCKPAEKCARISSTRCVTKCSDSSIETACGITGLGTDEQRAFLPEDDQTGIVLAAPIDSARATVTFFYHV